MSVTTSLGRVGLVLRGEYSPNTAYIKLDVVYSGNGAYICRKPCTGIAVSNAEYWQVIVDFNTLASDMATAISEAIAATEAANTAAEEAVEIAELKGDQAIAYADQAGSAAQQTANTAASAANAAATNANNVAEAIRNISFNINTDAELEVNIPWQL